MRTKSPAPAAKVDEHDVALTIRRSLLYVPGASERMLRKAASRGADVLILDLEDSVHLDAKEQARARVVEFLGTQEWRHTTCFVRVNPLSTRWADQDLVRMRELRPAAVVLPKVSDPAEIASADDALGRSVPLVPLIETAAGVLAARSLAAASERVTALMFGAADYRESLRASRRRDERELLFARFQILHAARAAAIDAFDTPWFEHQDLSGLRRSCRQVRALGFDGKSAIHPSQIPVINAAFAPTPAEVERAQRIISVMEDALARRSAVASLQGELVESMHLENARLVIEMADRLGIGPRRIGSSGKSSA